MSSGKLHYENMTSSGHSYTQETSDENFPVHMEKIKFDMNALGEALGDLFPDDDPAEEVKQPCGMLSRESDPYMGDKQEEALWKLAEVTTESHVQSSDCYDAVTFLPTEPNDFENSLASLDVKAKLRGRILHQCHVNGKEIPSLNSPGDVKNELTPEEEEKREAKKLRNKESARKSRQKRKDSENKLREDEEDLLKKNKELKSDVKKLGDTLAIFENFVPRHAASSTCKLNITKPPQQDHGDDVYEATSGSSIFKRQDHIARERCTVPWDETDDVALNKIIDEIASIGNTVCIQPQQEVQRQHICAQVVQPASLLATSISRYSSPYDAQPECSLADNNNVQIYQELGNLKGVPSMHIPIQARAGNFTIAAQPSPSDRFVSIETGGGTATFLTGHASRPASVPRRINNLGKNLNPWANEPGIPHEEREELTKAFNLPADDHPPPEKKRRLQ